MYAMGQRVAKTLDGSRPGYRGDDAYGGDRDPTSSSSGGGKKGSTNNDYSFTGPRDLGVTTRTVDRVTAPEAKEYIGGQEYDVTPATKDIRERAKVKQAILNPTVKKNKIFDPISNSFINTFAPTEKPQFGILDLGLMLATGGLFGTKAKTLAQTYGAINRTKNLVNDLSDTFGFENPISNMFSGNKTSKTKATTKTTVRKY